MCISTDRESDYREKGQRENSISGRTHQNSREREKRPNTPTRIVKDFRINKGGRYSVESSPSPSALQGGRAGRPVSATFKQRYFGDTDTESARLNVSSTIDGNNYRSLPNRKLKMNRGSRQNVSAHCRRSGMRMTSPTARGSAGSSLQSSESEADSHGGSHASRTSRVSTGSNRSVYLHATAVADIPVRRSSDEAPSERGVTKQSKKVTRSFSLVSPWKPRHYREKYEVEYDNREMNKSPESADIKNIKAGKPEKKNALPPRPPRKAPENLASEDSKKVGRSQTVHKDSKLAGWLRKKRNKEVKGI